VIRVILPNHLRRLAGTQREIEIQVEGTPTVEKILDVVEASYPSLKGTIRDHVTKERRAFIRFFVCGEDWSHEPTDTPLPDEITSGSEPLRIIGALAGG
jgi:hypothetical protein